MTVAFRQQRQNRQQRDRGRQFTAGPDGLGERTPPRRPFHVLRLTGSPSRPRFLDADGFGVGERRITTRQRS